MVLKRSKFGGNSGNTLRRKPNGVFNPAFQRNSFITKSTKTNQHDVVKEEWIGDYHLSKNSKNPNSYNKTTNSVKFSLNKKKRWQLPDKLKYEVSEEFQQIDDEIVNEVVRKEKKIKKTKKQNKLGSTPRSRVAVIEEPKDDYLTTNQSYCSYFSDSQDKMAFRESENMRAKIEVTPHIEDVVDILYTIQKPFSSKVWPYHVESSKKKGIGCCKKSKRLYASEDFDEESLDDFAESYEIYDDEYQHTVSKTLKPESLKLKNFLKMDEKVSSENERTSQELASEKVDPASTNAVQKYPKGSFIIVENQMMEVLKKIEPKPQILAEVEPVSSSYQEFQCLLSTKEITSTSLKQSFGNCYREGGSYPRSFLITNEEYSMNGTLAHFQVCSNIEDDTSLVSVQIFCPLYEKPVICDEVMEMTHLTRLIFGKKSKTVNCNAKICESSIHPKYQPEASIIDADKIWFNAIKSYPPSSFYHQEPSDVCPICFSDDSINIVYLKECGHSFCSDCFESYIKMKISDGIFTFSCLEYKCEIELDYVTLLGFVDIKFISMLNKKIVELFVQKDNKLEFCPNNDCNKVALVKENAREAEAMAVSNNAVVVCACLKTWCFGCQKNNHWPSSCAAYESYMKQREIDVGVIFDTCGNFYEVSINFRRCPFCRNPVEKDGGCNYMDCSCGREFCWDCLRDYNDCDYFDCQPLVDDSAVLTSLDDKNGAGKLVQVQRKAYLYASIIQEISLLKRKLKIEKYLIGFKLVMDEQKSQLLILKRCFDLLKDGYTLMENLTVARAFSKSKHLSDKILNFAVGLEFDLNILKQSLPVQEIKQVDIDTVLKNEQFVRSHLDRLKFIVH